MFYKKPSPSNKARSSRGGFPTLVSPQPPPVVHRSSPPLAPSCPLPDVASCSPPVVCSVLLPVATISPPHFGTTCSLPRVASCPPPDGVNCSSPAESTCSPTVVATCPPVVVTTSLSSMLTTCSSASQQAGPSTGSSGGTCPSLPERTSYFPAELVPKIQPGIPPGLPVKHLPGPIGLPDTEVPWTLPGKIITLISDKVDLLRIQVSVNGHVVSAIIDTGAETSLISHSLASRLNLIAEGTGKTYRVIGGNDCETMGSAIIPISIHGVNMQPTKVVIFPTSANSNISLLLGINFLKSNDIEI